ncbi:hypothetical protein TNCV_3468611 [Trichonephila clavipes]|nr:hypothetical protein TNCV_3468611 [Trichonephila clavipes]
MSFRDVGGRGRETSDHPRAFPQNWGGTEQNRTVTCIILKATANDRRTASTLATTNFVGLGLMLLPITRHKVGVWLPHTVNDILSAGNSSDTPRYFMGTMPLPGVGTCHPLLGFALRGGVRKTHSTEFRFL